MTMLDLLGQMTLQEGVILGATCLGAGIAAALGGKKGWSIIIRPRNGQEEKETKPAGVRWAMNWPNSKCRTPAWRR